eukprot:gnl/MRDRNA2_/MRDRNA2_68939_c0_seq2.p1 gnl/MRDRNA2_/MRDRNA2_68939_c0~~gnl/MRDRNA2_/MRDRNA2_68939_c0_seq2.p1  ORF type:complete len:350 (+),score=36.38 gnl/MRDRNA2_/MRDRNA2_68939_c0_seq2:145-1050(+)
MSIVARMDASLYFSEDGVLKENFRFDCFEHNPYTEDSVGESDPKFFGYDYVFLQQREVKYCLGLVCSTRRKIAKASGCFVEVVKGSILMAGSAKQRSRAKDYIMWLLEQRGGRFQVKIFSNPGDRDDCDYLIIPRARFSDIAGHKGATIRHLEDQWSVFICIAEVNQIEIETNRGYMEKILICGWSRKMRKKAKTILKDRWHESEKKIERDVKRQWTEEERELCRRCRSSSRSWSRGRDRSKCGRSRSPAPTRPRSRDREHSQNHRSRSPAAKRLYSRQSDRSRSGRSRSPVPRRSRFGDT